MFDYEIYYSINRVGRKRKHNNDIPINEMDGSKISQWSTSKKIKPIKMQNKE